MSKEAELINRLKQDVQKAGLPTEIQVTAMLEEYGWQVINQPPYLDSDDQRTRTIDMWASKHFMLPSKIEPDMLIVWLVVECKSSQEKPWLFYPRPKETSFLAPFNYSATQGFSNEFQADLLTAGQSPRTALFRNSHYFWSELPDRAIAHHVGFAGQGGAGSQIFAALNQVTKATSYLVQHNNEVEQLAEVFICLYYPLIVFDGWMGQIQFQGDDVQIAPTSYVQYDFTQSLQIERVGPNTLASPRRYLVDITQKSNLPAFLKMLQREEESWGIPVKIIREQMLRNGQRLIDKQRRKS
jgi:hypothetical protein